MPCFCLPSPHLPKRRQSATLRAPRLSLLPPRLSPRTAPPPPRSSPPRCTSGTSRPPRCAAENSKCRLPPRFAAVPSVSRSASRPRASLSARPASQPHLSPIPRMCYPSWCTRTRLGLPLRGGSTSTPCGSAEAATPRPSRAPTSQRRVSRASRDPVRKPHRAVPRIRGSGSSLRFWLALLQLAGGAQRIRDLRVTSSALVWALCDSPGGQPEVPLLRCWRLDAPHEPHGCALTEDALAGERPGGGGTRTAQTRSARGRG